MKRYIYLIMLAISIPTFAAKVNGIYYKFDSWSPDHPFAWVSEPMSSGSNAGYNGDFVIPDSVTYNNKTYPVEGIRREAFLRYSGTGITSITIPKTMKLIEEWAFNSCPNLTKVIISDLSAWCGISFNGNNSNPLCVADSLMLADSLLTDIIIPEDVTTLVNGTFRGYKKLTSVILSGNVKTIGSYAFAECTNLSSASLNEGCITIGESAFSGCAFDNLTLPLSVETLGKGAFASCPNLTEFILTENIKTIGYTLFSGCNNIQRIVYNVKQCENLLGTPFYNMPALTDFQFGDVVENIPDNLCNGLKRIRSVTIPKNTIYIGTKAFYQCDSLQNIVIPDNVEEMGQSAFENCVQLESVSIGNGLTIVPENAFKNCTALKSLTLGNGVKTLKANAFYGCEDLMEINNYRTTPGVIYSTTFDGVDKFNCNLQVPEQSLDLYCNASGWMEFYSIRKLNQATQVATPDESVVVNSGTDNATITWLGVEHAISYQFVIRDMFGRPICTLIFNLSGQLTGIRFAPQRNHTEMNGLQFTVTGLESNSEYSYDITALDEDETPLEQYTGTFKTKADAPTYIEGIMGISIVGTHQKLLLNGQVIILTPDGRKYNTQGIQLN